MNRKTIIQNKRYFFIYAAVAACYFWMAAQIPYTHDDWDWGLDIGMHQLIHGTVNSRYVGNFFEVVMTRSEILKTVIMGICYFLLPFSLATIATSNCTRKREPIRFWYFLICNLLLLTMHRTIWRQVYGWVAGFANFAISAVFMMPWLYELYQIWDDRSLTKRTGFLLNCLLLILSVCSQLFLENLAIYHVLVGLTLCIAAFIRTKKVPSRYLAVLAGFVIGLIIMFSSSIYGTLMSTGTGINNYRQIPILQDQSIVHAILMIIRVAASLLSQLYAYNGSICIAIIVTLTYLFYVHRNAFSEEHYNFITKCNLLLMLLLVLCYLLDNHLPKLFYLFVSLLFLFAVSSEIFLLFRKDSHSLKQLFTLWIAAPLLILPLVLTTETGARLFFNTNILLILFLLCLLMHCIPHITAARSTVLMRTIALSIGVCFIFHGIVYTSIGICKRNRAQIIATAIQESAEAITLPAYPFQEYLHWPNPNEDCRIDYFKEFYHIPLEVNITFEE